MGIKERRGEEKRREGKRMEKKRREEKRRGWKRGEEKRRRLYSNALNLAERVSPRSPLMFFYLPSSSVKTSTHPGDMPTPTQLTGKTHTV